MKPFNYFTSMFPILDEPVKIKDEVKHEIKQEPIKNVQPPPEPVKNCYREENSTDDDDEGRLVIKDEPNSQDEAEDQNVSTASSCDYSMSQFKKDESQFDGRDDSQNGNFKMEPKEEEESDEDVPLVRI